SPEKFEGWVRDQLSRRRVGAEVAAPVDSLSVLSAAQPVLFEAASFGRLNDFAGRGFKGDELSWEFREVDWTWRHLVVQANEESMLAVERARITAFDMVGGKIRWDVPLGNGWSPSPVRPLVVGQRLYIRAAIAPDRAGVVCLDGKTGQRTWIGDCGGTAASDPLWYRGRLFVITLGPAGGQFVSPLCLVELHPETGDVLSRQQILEMAQREKLPAECQASYAGNRLIVLVAGSVIATDPQGRIVWLRHTTTLPSAIDPAFVQQHCQPAIQSDGWLFVEQPGSCVVDCLSLETGQRRWRRGIVGLQRIVDLPDDRLLARTARGLVALNKTTGEVLWQREFPGMLSALALTPSGLILCARQTVIGDKSQIVLLWIDMATGQMRAHGAIALEKNQPIFFGPIVARGDRTWCCFGYGAKNDSPTAENAKRIIELRPGKPAVADEAP
ncbi:MAG: PQQ-binding-like beta-propeller repeat protein, partial [Thermoguttaceae bacterium]